MTQQRYIVGVDEAGRGALIGDVVAAAVILPEHYDARLLKDSKTLSEAQRFERAAYIKDIAISWACASASPAEIDARNIHHATLLAMQRAVLATLHQLTSPQRIAEVWIDGKFAPTLSDFSHIICKTFVKGDATFPEISAASILAKTHRDTQLIELDQRHPQYGFARHKGYATRAHYTAIAEHGVLPEHRRSYRLT